MQYRVTLVESDEGVAVWCDDLPGCCSQGADRAEALANIREAIVEYHASLREDVPRVFGTQISHEVVEVEPELSHA